MKKSGMPGMITPFAAVSFVLVISLFLSLLEGARLNYGRVVCNQQATYGAQSFLGFYEKKLLDKYGVYGVDGELYKNREAMVEELGKFLVPELGQTFLNPASSSLENFDYRLLTDNCGADFRKQAVESYIYSIPEELIEKLKQEYEVAIGIGGEGQEAEIIDNAEKALKEAESTQEEQYNKNLKIKSTVLKLSEANPIKKMKEQKQSFVLATVLPEDYQVSNNTMKKQKRLEDQQLVKGTMEGETPGGDDYLLFPFYLREHFTHALSGEVESHLLKYQLEYILIGKASDVENLEDVLKRLILFREMVWFAYRLTDAVSVQQARSIATALMGGVGLPILIEPVAWGILLAWSYEDAIEDVQELMKGNRVSLLPDKKGDPLLEGKKFLLSYEEYLHLMLMLESREKMTLRTLDIVEETLTTEDTVFSANEIITGIEGKMAYHYELLFAKWIMVPIGEADPVTYYGHFKESYCR